MLDLNGILTKRAKELLDEVKSLQPDKEISFSEMTDKELLKTSEGASATKYPDRSAIIYLDPLRADEFRLVHEIMHVKLMREGWPQIFPLVPEHFTKEVAMRLDNLIDHYVFMPEIDDMGIDCTEYREKFTSNFNNWNTQKNAIGKLKDSFLICEALLFGEPYRTRTIKSVENEYKDSLDLALQIEEIITSSNLDKKDIRKKAVEILNLISHWDLLQQHPEIPFLRHIIGISPIFPESKLSKKASKYLILKSTKMGIYEGEHALDSLILKSDKTCIKTYIDNNRKTSKMKRFLNNQSLKGFLEYYDIIYGLS